jgi:acetyl esterase/lipase
VRVIIALLILLESFFAATHLTSLVPTLVVYPWFTLALLAMRLGVSFVQFAGGWWLLQRRPPGASLVGWSCLASAGLRTLELGFRLAPSNLFPAYHWPLITGYWIYAIAVASYLRPRV